MQEGDRIDIVNIFKEVDRDGAAIGEALIEVEIEIEDRQDPMIFAVPGDTRFFDAVRHHSSVDAAVHIFERDHESPLTAVPPNRRAIRLVGHRAHKVTVKVHYDHLTHEKSFAPSKTIFAALQWAVGKHGFNLDAMLAAKANLILRGASEPLPRDTVIGKYVIGNEHVLIVDLTLKDFTNG